MSKQCNIEKWLRERIIAHKHLAVTNKGSVNAMLHYERVLAYQNVLVEMGYEELREFAECIKEPSIL